MHKIILKNHNIAFLSRLKHSKNLPKNLPSLKGRSVIGPNPNFLHF